MEIKIKKLIIENFKKIKQMALNFNGENVNVYGDNETGKTTINDAFTWVLFGKDSLDRDDTNKDFEIKPKDANGNQVHHLETKVELILDVDGRELKLKRVFYEVYKGKRGNELEFDKNTTDFYINDSARRAL
jgi:predicted ATP-dependent endonuclease of OLD family